MNRLVLCVSLVSAMGALGADAKPTFVLGGSAANGEAVFKTYCSSCHGETGAGDGAAAAAITPKPANFADQKHAATVSDEYIYKMIKDGGAANGKSPFMVAWGPVLSDDGKLRDVAAYVRSLSKPAAPPKKASKK